MKNLLIWIFSAAAIFLIALQVLRSTLPDRPSTPDGEVAGRSIPPEPGSSIPGSLPAKSGKSTARPSESDPHPEETLRIPPAVTDLFRVHAIDIDSGEFTPQLREFLDLNGKELAATHAIFEDYFRAHAEAELATATFLTAEELAKERAQPNEKRIAAIRIVPLEDRMAGALTKMRNELIELLGRSRGFAAASLLSHQLGNAGRGGELVSFVKYPNEQNYRLEVKGQKKHVLRAGSWTGRPIYKTPDFSQLARYRHLAELANE